MHQRHILNKRQQPYRKERGSKDLISGNKSPRERGSKIHDCRAMEISRPRSDLPNYALYKLF